MEEKDIHLRDYIRILKKRKLTIFTFFSITFLVVFIGTFTAPPVYKASTKVLIEKGDANPLGQTYPTHFIDPEFLETQVQIIKSRSVADRVVTLLALDTKYRSDFIREKSPLPVLGPVISWLSDVKDVSFRIMGIQAEVMPGGETVDEGKTVADMIARSVSAGLEVEPLMNSRVVTISFMSENPVLAGLIANTAAEAYIDELLDMRMQTSGYAIDWMTRKADEEREKLAKSENMLQTYVRANDIVTIEDRVAIIPQKLGELGSRLTKAEAERKEMEALYEKINDASPEEAETMAIVASNQALQSIQDEILRLEQRVTELSEKYGKKHPARKRVEGELKAMSEKKIVEISRIIKSVENEYELARTNEDNLKWLLERTKTDAVNLKEKLIQYGILKREVDTNRHLYDALLTKIKEQRIMEKIQPVSVSIIDKAETPDVPSKPRKKLNLLLAIVLGLFGGAGLAFFIEYLDNTVKSPEETEEKLGAPVLGVIPILKNGKMDVAKVVCEEPSSSSAESYRGVRVSVMLSLANKPPKTILVTSMSAGEGKTTTASNLAVSFAHAGKKTLLIDSDLRRPRLHTVFDLDNTEGLSTYLAGNTVDGSFILKGPAAGLHIITSGPLAPTPSELLSSERMAHLLEKMANEFDVILLDSPPVTSATDTMVLKKIMQQTIVVVRSGRTTYEVAGKGLKRLQDIDSKMPGIVINAADLEKDFYSYYGYDGYYSS